MHYSDCIEEGEVVLLCKNKAFKVVKLYRKRFEYSNYDKKNTISATILFIYRKRINFRGFKISWIYTCSCSNFKTEYE